MIFSKTTFMKTFFEGNPEKVNIELSIQLLKDLVSPNYNFSDSIDINSKVFLENGQERVISQYVLFINEEIGNVFSSQINPMEYNSSFFENIANYVGFHKEEIFQRILDGTLSVILSAIASSILIFMGMTSGVTIAAAFLGAFLGFLIKKIICWFRNDENSIAIVKTIKDWAAKVYSDYVLPNDFNTDFETILNNLENEDGNDDVKIQMKSEKVQQHNDNKLEFFKISFDKLGFLDLTKTKTKKEKLYVFI
jgi:hypothetical protein